MSLVPVDGGAAIVVGCCWASTGGAAAALGTGSALRERLATMPRTASAARTTPIAATLVRRRLSVDGSLLLMRDGTESLGRVSCDGGIDGGSGAGTRSVIRSVTVLGSVAPPTAARIT